MCYEYSLRKKVKKEELENRKESVSMWKPLNAWMTKAKMAFLGKKSGSSDLYKEADPNVRDRMTG
ncbi:MAG: hypothetical protein MI754_13665 [Chromatiales bacterium]|nr:hypothetical protein [Chromatiales bacterium]